jgi:integrase
VNNQGKSVQITGSIRLYKQVRSPYWWVSVSLVSGQKRLSTKIHVDDDVDGSDLARNKAIELATELKFKVEHGIDISGQPTFSSLCDDLTKQLNARLQKKGIYTDYKSVITNYLKPFFKRMSISDVDRYEIHRFYMWREKETSKEISLTQKRVTNKVFTMVFDLACDLGHIKQIEIPKLPHVGVKAGEAKDHFTHDELIRVLNGFDAFIDGAKSYKTREIRNILKFYTHFLSGSGARPGEEVVNLKYGDIGLERLKGQFTWTASITKGKVSGRKGSRKIILSERAIDALECIISYRQTYDGLKLRQVITKKSSDYIFHASYRESAPDLVKPFEQYMAYLELGRGKHTLYSLRHTYITHALLLDNIPRRAIAKQCGTSEEMIEQYYDHVVASDFAEELKKSDNMPSLTTVDISRFMED